MKKNRIIITIAVLSTLVITFQNCGQTEFTSATSQREFDIINSSPFIPENLNTNQMATGGVSDHIDSKQSSAPYELSNSGLVTRCTTEIYEKEKKEVLEIVRRDNSKTLIPVRFSISSGNILDGTSYLAYQRSILKKNDDGVTEVYVGPSDQFIYRDKHANVFHYKADHTQARDNYIKGKRCFFDVIKAVDGINGEIRLNGAYNHSWAILNYGNKYSSADPDAFELSPRLFKKIENLAEPQIIPLYVADIREQYLSFTNENYTLLNPEFTSNAERRKEYKVALKELFYLDRLFQNRDKFIEELSSSQSLQSKSYSGYDGVPQLFDNLIFGHNATVLSMQYTPIVLDLGEAHIRTSSLEWGSFFNLANIKVPRNDKGYKRISHQVAWVGGKPVQVKDSNGKLVWRRVADDGFLVLPDENGEIHSSKQLLSNQTEVYGRTYENGFAALIALANKQCKSFDVKQRYIGPWDEAYNVLKIWVDANRNGVADKGEIRSLKESSVAALNPCFYNHQQTSDSFGNSTKIRSSFLMAKDLLEDGDISEGDIREIESRLFSGKIAGDNIADFRTMIDIYFRSKPSFYLENLELDRAVEINQF